MFLANIKKMGRPTLLVMNGVKTPVNGLLKIVKDKTPTNNWATQKKKKTSYFPWNTGCLIGILDTNIHLKNRDPLFSLLN